MTKKLNHHFKPENLSDIIAFSFTKFLRFIADFFFAKRYGHRAVVLETVAAVPGMVAGMLNHLKSLRRMEQDPGWIKVLLDEAENERMHLMTFIHIAKPSSIERFIIILVQGIFFNFYFFFFERFLTAFFGAFVSIIDLTSSKVSFTASTVFGSSTFILPFMMLCLPQRAFSTRIPSSAQS